MEVVIDYEVLPGAQDEEVVKEHSVAADVIIQTFHFKSPYVMRPHASTENGVSCGDGIIEYNQLYTVLIEALAVFAHLYSYDTSKCKFLTELIGRPF
jgi:hypothetical protein